ncbi:hypothetical protein C8035_v009576 [Colletotrichum spinosum]|uniref:Uncharacterized protein n=1 Tax=Colletotrichum spinosum TaxID=1347390 RepID=A0A4R8QDS8_9PEZI|nr:hypothetical protein C8035_v009576 [Colletotrichum spinosum]
MARRLLHASSKYWHTRLRGRRWLTQPQTFLYLHLRRHLHLHPYQHLHPPLPPSLPPSPAALPSPSLAPSPSPPTRPTSAPSSASEQNHLSPASQPLILRPPCRIQCPVQIERQEGLRRYTVRVPSGAGVPGQLLHRDWPICC